MKPLGPVSAAAATASQNLVVSQATGEIIHSKIKKKEDSKKSEGSFDKGLRSLAERKTEETQEAAISFNEFLELFKKNPEIAKYNDIQLFNRFEEKEIILNDLIYSE